MTLTETNTGDEPVTVSVSPTDFSISERAGVIWESNPANAGQPPTSLTLQPGQSLSQTAAWGGRISSGQYSLNQFGTFTVSNPNAPEGVTAAFQITNPLKGSLTADQSTYTVGQSVQLTFTETNTSCQSISVFSPGPLFQILQNDQPLLPISDPLGTYLTFAPGQTITHQDTWDGLTSFGTVNPERPIGSFVAEAYAVPADPGNFSADFQIWGPPSASSNGTDASNGGVTVGSNTGGQGTSGTIVLPLVISTVSTDKHSYKVGQSVRISLTIQHGGNAATALPPLKGHEVITITDGSIVIWKASRKVLPAVRHRPISPHQTVTMTVVWNGQANRPGVVGLKPGRYTIHVVDGDYSGTSTIAIGRNRP
jgi:hypothetical protein